MDMKEKTPEALIPALRQYRSNREDRLLFGYDIEETNKAYLNLHEVNRILGEALEKAIVAIEAVTYEDRSGLFISRYGDTDCSDIKPNLDAARAALKKAEELS
jgi:hypothetical protein